MRSRAFAYGAGIAALVSSTTVSLRALAADPPPDRATCIAAAERGQKARKDGRLPEAQKDFLVCGRAECPAFVRTDCAQWLNEVVAVMPSIVVAARMQGKDLFDVKVIIDGQLVTERLDGKGIPMSTGEHALRFEYGSEAPIEAKVLMREGDKNRAIDVTFPGAGKPPGNDTTTVEPGRTGSSGTSRTSGGGHSVLPWIVTGVGGAAAVTGIVLMVVSDGAFPSECNRDDLKCQPGPTPEETNDRIRRAESAHGQSNTGLGLLIGGAVVAAGGLVWHFLEPTGEPASSKSGRFRLAPSVGAREQSLMLTGRF